MKISFVDPSDAKGSLAVLSFEDDGLSSAASAVNDSTGGAAMRATGASRFRGKVGQIAEILAPGGVEADRILVVGAGKADELDRDALERIAASAVKRVLASGEKSLTLRLDGVNVSAEDAAAAGVAAHMAAYRFDHYRTKLDADKKPSLESFQIAVDDAAAGEDAWSRYQHIAEGVSLARDLVGEPPNVLFPAAFAERCQALEAQGVEVEVLDEKKMAELGMNALLCVGQGSRKESKLAIMKWMGGDNDEKPILLVGKGVCFDAGGISLKPGDRMWDMKADMGGAAGVTGAMRAIAGRKAKVNVIGIVGLVENMPDGDATRPSDIVKSASGQTIEVQNTDAEGRLVLSDALWYGQTHFDPACVIDMATLTGAMVISLGQEYAGVFTNSDTLWSGLEEAGRNGSEQVWRLPLADGYDRLLDSDYADMKNIGGRAAGSITAAQFLGRFIDKDRDWAHIDIAGVAMKDKRDDPREPVWGTGWGVRILDRFAASREK